MAMLRDRHRIGYDCPMMELHFSNKIEILYERLKEGLFATPSPFIKRQLFVSSSLMKGWLTRRLADDLGISMGIEIHFHQQMMRDLARLGQLPHHFPSSVELSLAIETHLKKSVLEGDPSLIPLIGSEVNSRKSQRRLALLARDIANLFTQYGLYGSPIINDDSDGWQRNLWQKLFENEDSSWTYPLKMVKDASKMVIDDPVEIHLFGVSYLPPVYHRFLQQLAHEIPINYYLLSPTQTFWSDIVTDKQLGKMLKKMDANAQEEMEDFLRDRNTFLANMGKLGRQFLREIEKEDLPSSEDYALCSDLLGHSCYHDLVLQDLQGNLKNPSLLDYLQADLLLLRSPHEKIDLKQDSSVTVHSAPSLRREVEVLYDNILRIMHEHRLQPEEILVMAPDINLYASTIHSVFACQGTPLPYQIYNLSMLAGNRLAKGFILLLDLADSRWDCVSLMQLFEHPDFQKAQGLKPEDVAMMRDWAIKTQISWGEDIAHRSNILVKFQSTKEWKHPSDIGTWRLGIDRLLDALALGDDLLAVEFSQGPMLGCWIEILRRLRDDLHLLEAPKTLNAWIDLLLNYLQWYFSNGADTASAEEYESLKQVVVQLHSKENEESLYSWTSIRLCLDQLLNRQETSPHESNFNAVRFCSLAPMRGMPAQALFLVGMDEMLFPRKKKSSSHEVFSTDSGSDIPPSPSDYDRYLFLEAILSARSFLTISYTWGSDNSEKIPSIVVSELVDYLDHAYTFDGEKISDTIFFHHPHTSYSTLYFEEGSQLTSYVENSYRLAQATLQNKRHVASPSFSIWPKNDIKEKGEVLITKFSSALRNPIRSYLRNLNIYLNDQEKVLPVDEPFLLNSLDLYQWKKEMFSKTTEEIVLKGEREGKLPSGLFGQYAIEIIDSHRQAQWEALEALHIDPSEIFSVSFQDHSSQIQQQEHRLPPVEVSLEGLTLFVTGKIEGITPQGCIIDDRMTAESLVKHGATIALFHKVLSNLPFDVLPIVHFLRDGKRLTLDKTGPHLSKMLKYAFSTEKHLFLYLPEWIDAWLNTSTEKLNSCIEKSLSDPHTLFFNKEALWLWRGKPLPIISSEQHREGSLFILEHLPYLESFGGVHARS